ncbi:dual 3',5'-cyclic-AMP and -GMP phosphodiesterase 11 [Caerostris darwini]|uniref:Dual 3',5'-cyclic-AMP and -GMP phosphodiesterase 11 n=1 Tax=Caerostris darwini TaxID=1538125 RepID=A0AAV4S0T5_9ARAC|nr:dual 3',5'-cyclic-AMP and -GMP phosphodiesterase 11 [Caerostris darwini]
MSSFQDDRFNCLVDSRTDQYKTHNMMCMPFRDTDDKVKAISQIINKYHGKESFMEAEEETLSRYLLFYDIVLRNAKLYERSELENKRNQVLVDLASLVFEEQSTIEQTVHSIMIHMLSFLQTERCQVLLLDENTKTFSRAFDLNWNDSKTGNLDSRGAFESCFVGITGNLATTGKVFAIFYGLGIQYAQLPERTRKAIAKTKVTLEVQSYHATTPLAGTQELLREYHIPSTEIYKLHDLKFDDFSLNDEEMLKACLRMFMDMGLIQRFGIEYDGNQILSHLTSEEYMNVVHVLKNAILSTDLTVYYKKQFTFTQMARQGNFNRKGEDNRELLRTMLMMACDIAAITKPWEIQKKAIINREKKEKLPLMQVEFIDSVCLPVYKALAMISNKLGPLLEGVKGNRTRWLKLAEEKELCFSSEDCLP